MNAPCTIHDVPMSEMTSKIKFNEDGSPKTYFAHRTDNGLCFGESIRKNQQRTAPIPQTREPVEDTKADWDAKDRQSMAQTAMKSATELLSAMLNSGYATDYGNIMEEVKQMANDLYIELKSMKSKT